MKEVEGTIHLQGGHHQSRFSSSKETNSPNIYLEWEQKVDQIFHVHLVGGQKQIDLVVLEFEDYATT